jgi:PRTRC genetic system protein C
MTLQTQQLERAFRYNSVDLIDPGPQYTAEQVRDFYSPTYPEILNAGIEGPEEKDGKLVYTFRRAVGTKGGTKANPGAYDCYAAAEPDEPMFILLARDKHAPALVWLWATLRELDGEDRAKVEEARACVAQMLEWGEAHGRKAVGLGHAALVGVMDLIRCVNGALAQNGATPKNAATSTESLLRILAKTSFDAPEAANG